MNKTIVLVAEDNADSRDLLCMLLENEGYVVVTANDGEKAIQLLDEIRPDVIITDLLLPLVGGGDLIRHVRKRAELADVPIVVTSAYGRHYESEALQAGATVVMQKPINTDLLISTIRDKQAHRLPQA
ncbi:MAG TPA: response regulator [Blastocatellia bacterium]|nr:response regulator [Blastocatellia bacterium]